MELLTRYNFNVKHPTIISGVFNNMLLKKILTYEDAVLLDSSIPNNQSLLGYKYPENHTYYVFEDSIIISKEWIIEETIEVVDGTSIYDKTITILGISDTDKNIITTWLTSMDFKFEEH